MKRNKRLPRRKTHSSQTGFTLIEVLASMFVLTIGLVSLAGVFGIAMAATQTSQLDLTAKQMASETMESVFTARQTTQLQWSDIQNDSAGGIFVSGMQPIYNAGPDGLIGTADDASSGVRTVTVPGKDGIVGTSDDSTLSLSNFQRSLQISPVTDSSGNLVTDLRTLTITIQYSIPRSSFKRNYVLTGYISQYR